MNDLRYALRQLVKRPGFAATAIMTLALGIGATTAIFSVVNAVLLRPLPYRDADRMVAVWESNPDWSERNVVSTATFVDWRERATSFEGLEAFGSGIFSVGITGDAAPDHIFGTSFTPGMTGFLGAPPALGLGFTPEDDPDAGREVLISHGLWQRRFGGDSAIVGRAVQIEERPYTVAGIMPRGFDFPTPDAEFWLPIRFDADDRANRQSHRWRVVGRLRPDVSIEQAQAEMDLITAQLRREHPETMTGWSTNVVPYRADRTRAIRPTVLILFGVVVVVLLVACANVANLLLSRAMSRERELAIRGALGAARGRVVRQLLTESLVLAAGGGLLGLLLAFWGIEALVGAAPGGIPFLESTRLDVRVLAAALAATLGAVLLFGLLPALRLSRTRAAGVLRTAGGDGTGAQHRSLRRALLVGEVALSLVLLTGAGLLTRSLLAVNDVDPGFRPENVLALTIDLPYARYDGSVEQHAFYGQLLDRIEALPGVRSAAGTPEPPVVGFNNTFSFIIQGRTRPGPDPAWDPVEVRAVTPAYFETLEIPVRRGRVFADADRADAPLVGIVNETLARRHWPGGDAIGQRISFDESGGGPWIEIVGVAGDTRHYGLEADVQPALYVPHAQKRWGWMSWMTLLIRTDGDPAALADAARQAVWSLDDRLPIRRLAPLTGLFAERAAERRFVTALLAGFAALALVLGAIGIYGVVAYSVAQRRREIGIRTALGARPGALTADVLREGLAVTLVGIALGLGAALAAARFLRSLLFGVTPHDPVTFVTVVFLLIAAALAASWLPARRAARIDPMEALRHE